MKIRFIFLELHQVQEAFNASFVHSFKDDPDILNSGFHLPLELGQNDHLELYRLFTAGLGFSLIKRMSS